MENWAPVVGYEDLYEVSTIGRVRKSGSLIPVATTFASLGRIKCCLWKDRKRKNMKVHRMVAMAFIGPIPSGYNVNHKDGDPKNNAVENLEIVTLSENINHMHYVLGKCVRPVTATKVDGSETRRYRSVREAARDGFSQAGIYNVLVGKNKQHKGFVFSDCPATLHKCEPRTNRS